jgi:hypothetical protein
MACVMFVISANSEYAKCDPRSHKISVHRPSKHQQQQLLHQYHLDRNFNHRLCFNYNIPSSTSSHQQQQL